MRSEKQFCVSGNAFVRAVAGSHINDSGGGAYEDKKKTRGAKKEGQIGDVSHKQLNAKSLQTSVHGPQRDCGAVISGGACQTIQINVAIHSLPRPFTCRQLIELHTFHPHILPTAVLRPSHTHT
ncbi:hypothetical protein J6590_102319 [Homalodisca vitripennis]|nr:hypothetical protein J6590_102319 [Homalodisca vitripennis]